MIARIAHSSLLCCFAVFITFGCLGSCCAAGAAAAPAAEVVPPWPASLAVASPLSIGAASAFGSEPMLAQASSLPDPKSHESIGWIIGGGAAAVAAIAGLLAFMRRESRMQEPPKQNHVSGGPVTIRHEEVFVERHEHVRLSEDLDNHKREIWEVVKGLRAAVGRIETSTSNTEVLREANGALLTEVREEVVSLGKIVARLTAIVETKLEAKHK